MKIKKLIIMMLLVLSSIAFISCDTYDTTSIAVEAESMDFEFYDNYYYDLDTGEYIENINYSCTSREIILDDDLILNSYLISNYALFWTSSNEYLGYYSMNSTYTAGDMYIDSVSSNYITIPENAFKIAFMINKNGTDGYYKLSYNNYLEYTYQYIIDNGTWGDTLLESYNPTSIDDYIDVEGYETLTYRDVFGDSLYDDGKTNLIDNGDFENDDISMYGSQQVSNFYITENQRLRFNQGDTSYFRALINIGQITSGDILYMSSDIYTSSGITSVNAYIWDGTNQQDFFNDTNILNDYSGITHSILTTSNPIRYGVTVGTSINQYFEIDNVMIYNLTTIFGAGNEPSINEFETMLDNYKRITQYDTEELTLSSLDNIFSYINNLAYADIFWQSSIVSMQNEGILAFNDVTNLIDSEGDFTGTYDSDNYYYLYNLEEENGIIKNTLNYGKNSFNQYQDYAVINDEITIAGIDDILGLHLIAETGTFDGVTYENIQLKPNTQYRIKCVTTTISGSDNYGGLVVTAQTDNILLGGSTNTPNQNFTFTAPSDGIIKLKVYVTGSTNQSAEIYQLIQIEEGTVATTYEEYIPSNLVIDVTEDIYSLDYGLRLTDYSNIIPLDNQNNLDITSVENGYNIEVNLSDFSNFYYTYTEDYEIGDKLTFNFDLENNCYYFIIVDNKTSGGTYDYIYNSGTPYINTEGNITITVETTDKYESSPEINFGFFMYSDEAGSLPNIGDYIEITNLKIFNEADIIEEIEIMLNNNMNFYEFWLGTESIVDVTDTIFNENYLYYMAGEYDVDLLNRLVVFSNDSITGEYLKEFNQDNFIKLLNIYFLSDYGGFTFTYGDYINERIYFLNPILYQNILDYTDTELLQDHFQERDYMIDLYEYYKRDIPIYVWYIEYGITEANFTSFYAEYTYLSQENIQLTYDDLDDITVIINRDVIIYEDDTAVENIEEGLLYITDDSTYIFTIITAIIIVISIILLAIFGADFKIIIFIAITELLLFGLWGWIQGWIIFMVGIALFIIIIIKFFINRKGGSD